MRKKVTKEKLEDWKIQGNVRALAATLDHPEEPMRNKAAEYLAEMQDKAIKELKTALSASPYQARMLSVHVLGKIDTPAGSRALLLAMDDPVKTIAQQAYEYLQERQLSDQDQDTAEKKYLRLSEKLAREEKAGEFWKTEEERQKERDRLLLKLGPDTEEKAQEGGEPENQVEAGREETWETEPKRGLPKGLRLRLLVYVVGGALFYLLARQGYVAGAYVVPGYVVLVGLFLLRVYRYRFRK